MTDDELLAQVHAAFSVLDPAPPALLVTGRTALRHHLPHAALAELTADQDAATAGVRSRATRLLTFTLPGTLIEVEVSGDRVLEMFGRLMPPTRAKVLVRHPEGERRAETDGDGHFAVEGIPSGPVSLVFGLPDETAVVTSWIRL
jgi:hypothetical protein